MNTEKFLNSFLYTHNHLVTSMIDLGNLGQVQPLRPRTTNPGRLSSDLIKKAAATITSTITAVSENDRQNENK